MTFAQRLTCLTTHFSKSHKLWCTRMLLGTEYVCLFDVHRAVRRKIISIIKPTRCTSVSNLFYFGMTLYMFQAVFPSIIRISTVHIATGISQTDTAVCWLASRQQYLFGCCIYSLELLMMDGKTA